MNPRNLTVFGMVLGMCLGGPLATQEPLASKPPDVPHWMEYKRFTRDGGEILKDDAASRLAWWLERMGGELGPDFSRRYVLEAERERQKHPEAFTREGTPFATSAVGNTWVNLGPTGADFEQNGITYTKVDSGRIRAILPHPTDANTVYILCTGGGLWKTTNFLASQPTWIPTTDFVGSTMGGNACFGRDGNTVYLGMGESFEIGVGGFVVRTINGGSSWSPAVFLGSSTRIWDIKVDTSVGSDASTDIVLAGTNLGLFRSTNGGASFSQVGTISGARVCSIARTSAGWLAAARNNTSGAGTFYLSADKGASWSPVGGTPSGIGRTTLGVGLPGDSVVYAFAADTGENVQKDLYRSSNGGSTWTPLNLGTKTPLVPNGDQTNMDIMAGQAFFNQMLLVDPTDSTRNTVYIGGQLSSAKSVDGGGTWSIISNWLPGGNSGTSSLPYAHADMHSAAFSTASGSRLFFGTDGGLFTSTDSGNTFDDTKNKGVVSHLIYALAANPGTPGSALIGLQDNGTRIRKLSPSPSGTFNQIRGGDGFGVGWSQANQASVMASYVYNSIRRSTSNPPTDQSNFLSFVTGLPTPIGTSSGANNSYYFVTPIISPSATADPTGMVFFTYGGSGSGPGGQRIYKSGPSGWTTIGTAGSGGLTSGRFVRATPHGIGVHPTDLNRIIAAGNGGNALITVNGGSSWTEVFLGSVPPDGQNIGWVGFNSNGAWANNQIIYMAAEAQTAGATRVARTANGGSTWTKADTGLPDVPVTKVVVNPTDATGNTVYAATWLGVYVTTNGGASWAPLGTGFPQVPASDLYIPEDGTYLRVSTYGRGVWELSLTAPLPGPTITTQPASQTVTVPALVTFNVVATGTGTLTYQWKKNGSPILGGTGSIYTTPFTSITDNGSVFSVAVTDNTGTTNSSTALLTVNACSSGGTNQALLNPGFESGDNGNWTPSNSFIVTNDSSFTAHTGSFYGWLGDYSTATTDSLFQSVNIPANASAASLTFWNLIVNDGAGTGSPTNIFTAKIKNSSGTDLATLGTWDNTAPTGWTQRGPYNLLTYAGQTIRVYLTSVQPGGSGTGTSFLVDDFVLNVTTPGATLPTITTQPATQTVGPGQPVTFTVAASGSSPFFYQWRKNGTPIPGANNSTYTIASTQVSDAGTFDVQVANCPGTVTSNSATLSVVVIAVTVSPKPATVVTGGQV